MNSFGNGAGSLEQPWIHGVGHSKLCRDTSGALLSVSFKNCPFDLTHVEGRAGRFIIV